MDRSEQSSRLWYNQGTREERGEFQDGSVLIKLCFKVLANVPSQGREINKWGSGWLNNFKSGTVGCPQTSWMRLLHWKYWGWPQSTILHFILTVSEKNVTTSAVLSFGLFIAARDWPEPERPNRVSWGMIFLYCGLGLTAAVIAVCFLCCFLFIHCLV